MHLFIPLLTVVASFATSTAAQDGPVPPQMSLLYSMTALLGDRFSLGPIPTGDERIVIPIVGGSFHGPKMNGESTVLSFGADWRLTDAQGVIRPDARYNIRTNDGTNIYVRTEGYPLPDGRTMLSGKFETGSNGTYAWLNDVVGVGVLRRNGTTAVIIEMWHVGALNVDLSSARANY
ncbi:hypothetical protein DM02DRAFT_530093 [Periconia macrospinosa]|uniref:Uncharacterized protein n=1 Tax=Periconia macrospinosa TaxID=97972 RepID=A0A2V1DLA8_9PLEO|nr:hypothetical protein DM02DRAFT_530093 [Periconia macrospinosa]